jgi:hypothetical protein
MSAEVNLQPAKNVSYWPREEESPIQNQKPSGKGCKTHLQPSSDMGDKAPCQTGPRARSRISEDGRMEKTDPEFDLAKAIIEKVLEKHPKAKRIAVLNFLCTSIGYDYDDQIRNLYLDASLYRWNSETVSAIRQGLNAMFQNRLLKATTP